MIFQALFVSTVFLNLYAYDVKIVNGTDAGENEFPYAVSLRKNNLYLHSCGGTILNDKFILTAAHCVRCDGAPTGLSIQYGSNKISATNERSINVKKINCNGFDKDKLIFDVAVLELESPIIPGNWKPVVLQQKYNGTVERSGIIIGWGYLGTNIPNPTNLQKATLNVYTDEVCGLGHNLTHHICLGAPYVGACFGDSGTALLIDGIQAGIASYISNAQCGVSNEKEPNVYSKVATYYTWIAKIAGLK